MKREINIGFDNAEIWGKCELAPQIRPGRYDLVTPMDSALTIFETEFLAELERVRREGCDHLIVTGALPPEINTKAGMILGSLEWKFKKIEFRNPSRGLTALYESTST